MNYACFKGDLTILAWLAWKLITFSEIKNKNKFILPLPLIDDKYKHERFNLYANQREGLGGANLIGRQQFNSECILWFDEQTWIQMNKNSPADSSVSALLYEFNSVV